jgi:hypothetical protein
MQSQRRMTVSDEDGITSFIDLGAAPPDLGTESEWRIGMVRLHNRYSFHIVDSEKPSGVTSVRRSDRQAPSLKSESSCERDRRALRHAAPET